MQKAIIGKKVGMTQIFDETGKVIPVTVVEAGPCVVTQKKTVETDGYTAVQLGYEDVKESKLTKPEAGHLKKAGVEAKKHLKEFKLEKASEMNVGDIAEAQLDGGVAVGFNGLLLSDDAGACFHNGNRDHLAGLIEDLGHTHFLADDCLFHLWFSPFLGYWLTAHWEACQHDPSARCLNSAGSGEFLYII